jgi:DNA damage-inducible protein 1
MYISLVSPDCAEACGLMRLLDRRFAGTAVGVGTAKILGRIHAATIKLGNNPDSKKNVYLQGSFTVMEGKGVDMLFGLDMLKRFQACIDLKKSVLRFDEVEIPFLGEGDLPDKAKHVEAPGDKEKKEESADKTKPPSSPSKASTSTGPAASPPRAPPAGFPEEHIQQLMGLGATREQAVGALEAAGGNMDIAASLLFSMD